MTVSDEEINLALHWTPPGFDKPMADFTDVDLDRLAKRSAETAVLYGAVREGLNEVKAAMEANRVKTWSELGVSFTAPPVVRQFETRNKRALSQLEKRLGAEDARIVREEVGIDVDVLGRISLRDHNLR